MPTITATKARQFGGQRGSATAQGGRGGIQAGARPRCHKQPGPSPLPGPRRATTLPPAQHGPTRSRTRLVAQEAIVLVSPVGRLLRPRRRPLVRFAPCARQLRLQLFKVHAGAAATLTVATGWHQRSGPLPSKRSACRCVSLQLSGWRDVGDGWGPQADRVCAGWQVTFVCVGVRPVCGRRVGRCGGDALSRRAGWWPVAVMPTRGERSLVAAFKPSPGSCLGATHRVVAHTRPQERALGQGTSVHSTQTRTRSLQRHRGAQASDTRLAAALRRLLAR